MDVFEIKKFGSIEEAPHYTAPEFAAADLLEACIVAEGTVNGNDTVDLVFQAKNGQKFVCLVKGSYLKMLGKMIKEIV